MGSLKKRHERGKNSGDASQESEHVARDFDNHLEAGFQLATFQGPLCAEPMEGLAFFVEAVEIDREGMEQERCTCHSS